MNRPLTFSYSDEQATRLRQYDVLQGKLNDPLPFNVPPRNEALRIAGRQLIADSRAVQLYLPWQQPLALSIPQEVVQRAEPNLAVAQKYRCRTITSLMIMQAAEQFAKDGQFPIGDLAEYAFSEFAVWIPERTLPLLRFSRGELALSLSTLHAIEGGRQARIQNIHLAAHEWERVWFSIDERTWLEKVLLENAKHDFDAGTNVKLKNPEFRYDVVSNSLFYAGIPSIQELVRRLENNEAQACYLWAPTIFFHPLLEIQRLNRLDFALLRRGFQTMQLDGPVWEVRLAGQIDGHKTT